MSDIKLTSSAFNVEFARFSVREARARVWIVAVPDAADIVGAGVLLVELSYAVDVIGVCRVGVTGPEQEQS